MSRLTKAELHILETYGSHPNYRIDIDHKGKMVAIPLSHAIDPDKKQCFHDNEKFITGKKFICNQAKVYQYDKSIKMLYELFPNGSKIQVGIVSEITNKAFLVDCLLLSQQRQIPVKFIDIIFF